MCLRKTCWPSTSSPADLPAFIAALDSVHSVIRYWTATGCLILQAKAAPVKVRLAARLGGEYPPRIDGA